MMSTATLRSILWGGRCCPPVPQDWVFPGVLPGQGLLGRALLFETTRSGGLQARVWQPAGKRDLLPLLSLPG